jgi:mannosyltransferase
VLLAALVRLPTLAQQSFWLDEGYTEQLVRMSLGGMLHAIPISESTPPLYYILAWGWTRVFGFSEFGIRSLSALAGILTVPVVYAVGARLAGRKAGLIAGALVALAPLMVWFSQEARSYALASLLSTVTLLCFVSFLDGRDARWLGGWAVSSGLGLVTHYFVAFVVGPEVVWLLWSYRRDRRVVAAVAFVLVVVAALAPLALAQRGTGHADYISQGSLATRLLQVPKQFLVGYASPSQVVSFALAALLVLVGGVQALLAYADRGVRTRVLAPLAVGLGCVLTPVALALVGVDFLNTRNLLPALPPLFVVVAIGFAARATRPRGPVLAGGLGLIFIAVVALIDTHSRYQRDNWRGASRALGTPEEPRAMVVTPGSGLIPLRLYQSGLRPLNHPTGVSELDVIAIPARVTGGGIGPPPRPEGAVALPPGFRLIGATYSSTYTVLRFRAQTTVAVTSASLAPTHLGAGSLATLVQLPRPGR